MPRSTEHRYQPGFTLLELVIVVILVCILFLTAVDQLLPLRGKAESAHVATTIGALRSALGLTAAEKVVKQGPETLAAMPEVNPMTLLQEKPPTYVGEHPPSTPQARKPGTWFYDSERHLLFYRVRFPQYLESASERPVLLRWQVRLQYDDANGNGRYDPGEEPVRGLSLAPLHEHYWPRQFPRSANTFPTGEVNTREASP